MLKQFLLNKRMHSSSFSMLTAYRGFTARIFVEGLPLDWTHHEIAQRFQIAGTVQKVNLVKNTLGHNTGKAIVTFEQETAA